MLGSSTCLLFNPQIQDRLHASPQRRHLGLAALAQSEVNKHGGDRDESPKIVRPHLCWSPETPFTLLFEASLHNNSQPRVWSLKDITLLGLFIIPTSLLLNTTPAACTCYTSTANSGERQRQTPTMTCGEASVYFTWECERPPSAFCKWLHLLLRESSRVLGKWHTNQLWLDKLPPWDWNWGGGKKLCIISPPQLCSTPNGILPKIMPAHWKF